MSASDVGCEALRSAAAKLVHDVRQPLSTIETCAYLLGMILPPEMARLHEQLQVITKQVEEINRMLTEAATAAATPDRPERQTETPDPAGESRPLTNAAMLAVT